MKRYLFVFILVVNYLFALSLDISNPSFAPENEYNFINKKEEAALTDSRGFYYNLSAQYVPPYLIDLETDEYYMVDESKNNRFSLNKLCKEKIIDLKDRSFIVTVKINDEKKEYPIFVLSSSSNGNCNFNSEIVYLETRSYKKPIKMEVDVKEADKSYNFEEISNILNSQDDVLKKAKTLKRVSFIFDPNRVKTNTLYIPLDILDKDTQINVGFISLILHPVASKLIKSDFTSYGYPNLSAIDIDSLQPLPHPFNPKRNLKRDVILLKKAAFKQDPNVIEGCDYFLTYIDEYDLNTYDKNAIFWLIFKDIPDFTDSLCYKEHEKYLVYTKAVPQPKDFVIPALKPVIPAKEIKSFVTLGSYNEVKEKTAFEKNISVKDLQKDMKEDSIPNLPLISNKENVSKSGGLVLAKETNEVVEDENIEENMTKPVSNEIVRKISSNDKADTISKKPVTTDNDNTESGNLRENEKEIDYNKIPFSGIGKKQRMRLLKNLSSLLRAKNKKRLSRYVFPKEEIYFTLLSDIPALEVDGLKVKETYIFDRDSLAKVLSPLEKEKFGCWFLLRSVKVKDKKAVSLAKELKIGDYEVLALYRDKNSEIGYNGYLIVLANFKKVGKTYVINSLAFKLPDEHFYEVLKSRTSKGSRCYRLLKDLKKDLVF